MRLAWFVPLVALTVVLACSTIASDDDDAGVTTNQSSDEGSSSGSSSGTGDSTSTATEGPVAETDPNDDAPKLDIPAAPDLPPTEECTTTWLSWDQVAAVYPDCAIDPANDTGGCGSEPMLGCVAPGPDGCTCPDGDCLATWSNCMGDSQGWPDAVPSEVCGPYVLDGLCCSIGEFEIGCAE